MVAILLGVEFGIFFVLGMVAGVVIARRQAPAVRRAAVADYLRAQGDADAEMNSHEAWLHASE